MSLKPIWVCVFSGPDCGAGPDGEDDGKLPPERFQDQEGHVPDSGATVQGAADQADDHPEKHEPKLRPLHHP